MNLPLDTRKFADVSLEDWKRIEDILDGYSTPSLASKRSSKAQSVKEGTDSYMGIFWHKSQVYYPLQERKIDEFLASHAKVLRKRQANADLWEGPFRDGLYVESDFYPLKTKHVRELTGKDPPKKKKGFWSFRERRGLRTRVGRQPVP